MNGPLKDDDLRPRTEPELVDFVRAIDVRAPESLHRQVEKMVADRSRGERAGRPARPRSRGLAPRLAGAMIVLVAVGIAIVAGVGGGSSALSIRQASRLTLRAATTPAPGQSTGNANNLTLAVDDVAFPYWEDRFGWRATGARSDTLDGRAVTTVFYSDARGHRIGYAIVSGAGAQALSGGTLVMRGRTPYRLLSEDGLPVVSWLRAGHLCVVSGRGVSQATLLRLAESSSERASVAS
jgi:hypothetical protein